MAANGRRGCCEVGKLGLGEGACTPHALRLSLCDLPVTSGSKQEILQSRWEDPHCQVTDPCVNVPPPPPQCGPLLTSPWKPPHPGDPHGGARRAQGSAGTWREDTASVLHALVPACRVAGGTGSRQTLPSQAQLARNSLRPSGERACVQAALAWGLSREMHVSPRPTPPGLVVICKVAPSCPPA